MGNHIGFAHVPVTPEVAVGAVCLFNQFKKEGTTRLFKPEAKHLDDALGWTAACAPEGLILTINLLRPGMASFNALSDDIGDALHEASFTYPDLDPANIDDLTVLWADRQHA